MTESLAAQLNTAQTTLTAREQELTQAHAEASQLHQVQTSLADSQASLAATRQQLNTVETQSEAAAKEIIQLRNAKAQAVDKMVSHKTALDKLTEERDQLKKDLHEEEDAAAAFRANTQPKLDKLHGLEKRQEMFGDALPAGLHEH